MNKSTRVWKIYKQEDKVKMRTWTKKQECRTVNQKKVLDVDQKEKDEQDADHDEEDLDLEIGNSISSSGGPRVCGWTE
ncbi:hypothetical protein NDU88_006505 [Pleurodeles waltl]|uniref:Uncharacterized protein n=1 Tax=Pleurodeles waltl TaxID=8319 RepID=A0AAV7PL84_PLEWA|nr:hypothetical protein NDU88_006505 [Pleurodeles waltl]